MPSNDFYQPSEHEADHTNPDHGLAVIEAHFVIPTQTARLAEPAKGPLHDPSLGQNLETFSFTYCTKLPK
jgi:hypothetical protein